MNKRAVIVLAAGKGTRMKSSLPKVLHKLRGVSLIGHVIDTAKSINPDKIVVIVGYRAELVKEDIASSGVDFVFQGKQLGTGHAVAQTEDILKGKFDQILVLSGDVPCIKVSTLKSLLDTHQANQSAITFLSNHMDTPAGYGRVVRDKTGNVIGIVEENDADPNTKEIKEVNSGIYCFCAGLLFEALKHIDRKNEQGEYYLTDTVGWAIKEAMRVEAIKIEDSREVSGINTKEDLLKMEEDTNERDNQNL